MYKAKLFINHDKKQTDTLKLPAMSVFDAFQPKPK
jgi:hypothetical protein